MAARLGLLLLLLLLPLPLLLMQLLANLLPRLLLPRLPLWRRVLRLPVAPLLLLLLLLLLVLLCSSSYGQMFMAKAISHTKRLNAMDAGLELKATHKLEHQTNTI